MLFDKQIATIIDRKIKENGELSAERLAYLNDSIEKMRTKIDSFFDQLDFKNEDSGRRVATITTEDVQRLFADLTKLRQQNLKEKLTN